MNWIKLKGLQIEADRIGRPICAWTPKGLNKAPNHDNPERLYIIDKTGKPLDGNYPKEGFAENPFSWICTFQPRFVEFKPAPPKIIELPRWDDRRKNPDKLKFRTMTLEEAKNLSYRDHVWFTGLDNKARICKVNGKPQTWVRTPSKVNIPVKYGMYEYNYFTEQDLGRMLIPLEE